MRILSYGIGDDGTRQKVLNSNKNTIIQYIVVREFLNYKIWTYWRFVRATINLKYWREEKTLSLIIWPEFAPQSPLEPRVRKDIKRVRTPCRNANSDLPLQPGSAGFPVPPA